MISIEFREDIIEEKEWIFPGNLSDIFSEQSDKSQKKNLIFPTREDIFRWLPTRNAENFRMASSIRFFVSVICTYADFLRLKNSFLALLGFEYFCYSSDID